MGNTTRNGPEDLTRIGGLSKRASKLLPKFSHANLSSAEEEVSDIDTGETEAEDMW